MASLVFIFCRTLFEAFLLGQLTVGVFRVRRGWPCIFLGDLREHGDC